MLAVLLARFLPRLAQPLSRGISTACAAAAPHPQQQQQQQQQSHYDVLGLGASASAEEVKAAFRRRAKQLHPDLQAPGSAWKGASSEAFLQLVRAYEVLSDPQRRRLYDLAQSQQQRLPGALRRAAAAAAAGGDAGSAPQADGGGAGLHGWRYGLGIWAQRGPEDDSPTVQDSPGALRGSVLSALARHRRDLEEDLHAALVRAFLGPRLDVLPGQLPETFEADERSHPSLTAELLHLVHGRSLLGVVRQRQLVQLEGAGTAPAAALPHSDNGGGDCAALPPGDAAGAGRQLAERCKGEQARDVRDRGRAGSQGSCAAAESSPEAVAADAAGRDSDEEIEEAEWRELLQRHHPLRCLYDWAPALHLLPEAAGAGPIKAAAGAAPEAAGELPAAGRGALGDAPTLGGRSARLVWEEGQALATHTPGDGPLCQPDGAAPGGHQKQEQQAHQEPEQPSRQQSSQQNQQEQQQQQRSRRGRRRSFQRLWRWVRAPTADWEAADWSFSDADGGVDVLELLLGHQLAALAIRDARQDVKPVKVYVAGEFVAAVLDDVVMEPMTGRLRAVIYRFATPGVHHCYFYVPNTHGSRVVARLQRRWMPPSSTWLFPPRADSHDVGGWLVEWEGHAAEDKPSWLHPAVPTLTAALCSLDMEARRLAGGGLGGRLVAALRRWAVGAWDRAGGGAAGER